MSVRQNDSAQASLRIASYAWVVVAASCALLVMHAGIMYSYGVFFKPLAASFNWSRAATSGAYSLRQLMQGVGALPMGWLADKFGPARVMAICGALAGLGLILTSRVTSLWQLYLAYGVVLGVGLSGSFTIATATTARWFVKRRGMALGIVAAGMGLGTFILLPVAERLVAAFDWPRAIAFFGIGGWLVLIPSALLLRYPRRQQQPGAAPGRQVAGKKDREEAGVPLRAGIRSKTLWMLISSYFLVGFCIQVVMLHLVNYATDVGISTLAAATAVSVIGIGGIIGRLGLGAMSDRIGSINALVICVATVMLTLVWLVFARTLWALYLFAGIFGLAYGGEVPQMAILVGQFFGLRAVAALVGAVMFGATSGGALGAWMGGKVFDITSSYQLAFIISAVAAAAATVIALMLKRQGKAAAAQLAVAGRKELAVRTGRRSDDASEPTK